MEELRDPITGRWTLMVANVNKLWGTTEVEFHLQRTIPFWHEINCEILLMQHKNLGGLKNRGVAHLELSSSAEARSPAPAAVTISRTHMVDTGYAIGDAPLRIDWRRPERYDDTIRAVYAANAPVTITKSDVSALFGRFGQIESIFLSAELPKKAPPPAPHRSVVWSAAC
ncbi:uncharacterized protein ACA1_296120 [Acanthamoeba castellanii str. Neff]|uniref:RRM domain-containing protein n=1 Tax=Acanthamoeba castellanii (strain ATCC 30010 / Neff) TaxID=1257118 RepID=L8HIT9_ACACF|nr:uncharacterized protein ACA1_296120 [Acanthamoeba castellanii str. Neff]ELR25524.1 hypothetical protein ACA1_296120 [Acanthamoeba castellanii str. Neff]